jgi:hypothetical protein
MTTQWCACMCAFHKEEQNLIIVIILDNFLCMFLSYYEWFSKKNIYLVLNFLQFIGQKQQNYLSKFFNILQKFIGKFGEEKLNILERKYRFSCLNNNNNNNNNNIRNIFLLKCVLQSRVPFSI